MIKDDYTKEDLGKILTRIKELFESEAGFLIVYNTNTKKITDLYKGICKKHILELVNIAVEDYSKFGLLPKN